MPEHYPPIDGPIEDRRRSLTDIDAPERTYLLKAAAWLFTPLVVLSFFVFYASLAKGLSLPLALLAGIGTGVGGAAFFYFVMYHGAIGGTTSLLGRLYAGGGGTPRRKTFWEADAALARGEPKVALAALELEVLEDPGDPDPCLRAAIICARDMNDPPAGIEWLLRARAAERIDDESAAYVSLRLAQLYEASGEAGNAMVELRRLLSEHAESKYSEGARRRLAELKREQVGGSESGGE
jgi:hypothetical protein